MILPEFHQILSLELPCLHSLSPGRKAASLVHARHTGLQRVRDDLSLEVCAAVDAEESEKGMVIHHIHHNSSDIYIYIYVRIYVCFILYLSNKKSYTVCNTHVIISFGMESFKEMGPCTNHAQSQHRPQRCRTSPNQAGPHFGAKFFDVFPTFQEMFDNYIGCIIYIYIIYIYILDILYDAKYLELRIIYVLDEIWIDKIDKHWTAPWNC